MPTLQASASINRYPYWGRKWRVVVILDDGTELGNNTTQNTGLDVSSMRVVFDVKRNWQLAKQTAECTIYNLNHDTEKQILSRGVKLYIEAGYADGVNYGAIFSGDIWQTKRGKDGKVNYTTTIQAISDNDAMNWGIVNFSIRRGTNYRDLLAAIAQNSDPQLELGEMPEGWGENMQLSRGMSITANLRDVLKTVGSSTNSIIRIDENKINVHQLQVQEVGEAFEMNYKTGLVGQPIQTKEGINFTCLLNPRIAVGSWVHINNALIQEMSAEFGENLIPNLDVDGMYRVVETTYRGDTRGNDWYMYNLGITQAGALPTFLADSSMRGI